MEYQIQANSRRCTATGKELQAGASFYSVLVDENGKLVRKDFSADAWQGPPAEAFSFWSGRVPARDAKERPRIDDDLLFDCLHRLRDQTEPDRVQFRYVVALLLLRRKRLKFAQARRENCREVLVLVSPRSREEFIVENPGLTEPEIAAVQDEVFRVLGWDQAQIETGPREEAPG